MSIKPSLLALSLAACLLAGCGGKATKSDNSAQPIVEDITLPPQMIQQTDASEVEGDPEETVSSEELRKSRESTDED